MSLTYILWFTDFDLFLDIIYSMHEYHFLVIICQYEAKFDLKINETGAELDL